MLQYYTLEQAAKLLDVSADRAKKLLDDHKVRQYRDGRGKVRYVASAVDELARTLGRGSDPELPLGEAPAPKSGSSPRPSKIVPPADQGGSFDFNLDLDESDEVPIGAEPSDKSASGSKKSGRSSGSKKNTPGPKSPAPKPGSDSDVRLVTEGDDLQISVDSDVKIVDEAASKSGAGKAKTGSSAKRKEERE